MMKHLLKLMWNRKRSNALVVAEIFVSFLVLFLVSAFAIYFISNARKPLGYEIANVWSLDIGMHQVSDDHWSEEMVRRFDSVLTELERMPQVRSAAGVLYAPYTFGTSDWNFGVNGRTLNVHTNEATDALPEVLGIEMIAGRWFGPEDDAANWKPVVIDRQLALEAFGRVDVVGERTPFFDTEHRVVGVIDDFRKGGELSAEQAYLFMRVRRGDIASRPPRTVVLKMAPGVPASFEEELVRRVSAVAPGWSFSVQPLERMRASALRLQLIPIVLGGIVAGFLILMVCLGLTGIMWQSVTRRMQELGLRRAVGAPQRGIYRQIVFETVILAAAGILAGLVIAVQLPIIGIAGFLGPATYAAAIAITSGTILLLAVLCGLYPGRIASRVQPADALRYE